MFIDHVQHVKGTERDAAWYAMPAGYGPVEETPHATHVTVCCPMSPWLLPAGPGLSNSVIFLPFSKCSHGWWI